MHMDKNYTSNYIICGIYLSSLGFHKKLPIHNIHIFLVYLFTSSHFCIPQAWGKSPERPRFNIEHKFVLFIFCPWNKEWSVIYIAWKVAKPRLTLLYRQLFQKHKMLYIGGKYWFKQIKIFLNLIDCRHILYCSTRHTSLTFSHFARLCFGVASIIDVSRRIHTVKIMLQVVIQSDITSTMGLTGQNQLSTSCENLDSSRLEPLSPTTYSAHTVLYSQIFPKSINVSIISSCRCGFSASFFFKGQCHEIFNIRLFHESVSPKPLRMPLRLFQFFLQICGDIHSSRHTNSVIDISGKWKKSSIRKS